MTLEPTHTYDTEPAEGESRMTTGALLGAVAAAVLAISVFFTWYSVDWRIAGVAHSEPVNGWDATNAARLVFLFALIGLAALAIEMFSPSSELPVAASIVSGVCGILAAVLIVYRMASTPEPQVRGVLNISSGVLGNLVSVSVSTSWGIWVSLIAAIVMVAAALLALISMRS
jgi:hypothetical protein